ncbi:MAG: glycoside hydrolase family 2 TIM barrel-domain containing protein, partial [bacterium]
RTVSLLVLLAIGLLQISTSSTVWSVPIPDSPAQSLSLDGTWKLRVIDSGEFGIYKGFTAPDYDDHDWPEIPAPANWDVHGFETPAFGSRSAQIGLYRCQFVVPQDWKDGVVFIRFEGVSFGSTVWINGREVGSNWSGFTPFEFQVAPILEYGGSNTLAVRIIKSPEICELDRFDTWSLSGIYRSATLIRKPLTFINDLSVWADYDAQKGTGRLRLQMAVDSFPPLHTRMETVVGDIRLTDQDGTLLLQDTKNLEITGDKIPSPYLELDRTIQNVKPWSAESPVLATLTVSLLSGQDVMEQVTRRVGFRSVTIRDGVLLLNGVPITLKGVCRDELHPEVGAAFTDDLWRTEIRLMKAANINAVRTAYHPPHSRFIELCDEMGLYVIEEVPFDSGEHLLWDTRYLPYFLLRARATVTRDRSYPSILIWSIGNENPYTGMCRELIGLVKALDPSRPVLCPQREENGLPSEVGILAPHFPTPERLAELSKNLEGRLVRPIIATAHTHALGDAFGGLADLWNVIHQNDRCAGGMIWLWADRGIQRYVDGQNVEDIHADPLIQSVTPSELKADSWIDENIVIDTHGEKGTDGIVSSNREPQPDYFETKAVYAPVLVVEPVVEAQPGRKKVSLTLENRYDFTDLSRVDVTWFLFDGRKQLRSGILPVKCKPHEQGLIALPVGLPKTFNHPEDVWLLITFADWMGNEVNRCRVNLDLKVREAESPAYSKVAPTIASGRVIEVTAGALALTVDGQSGELISVSSQGHSVLTGPLIPNGWRPRTLVERFWDEDNDLFEGAALAHLKIAGQPQVKKTSRGISTKQSYRSVSSSSRSSISSSSSMRS